MVSGRQIQLPAQRTHFVVGFKLIILSSFLLQKAFDHGFERTRAPRSQSCRPIVISSSTVRSPITSRIAASDNRGGFPPNCAHRRDTASGLRCDIARPTLRGPHSGHRLPWIFPLPDPGLKRIRVARRREAEFEFQLPPDRQHGHCVDAEWQLEVQPRLNRVENFPKHSTTPSELGSNRFRTSRAP
jgi:hypothetical protein